MAYLDETGLQHLWDKTTALLSSSSGGGNYTPNYPASAVVCYDNASGNNGTISLSSKTPTYCQYVAIQLKNKSWIVSAAATSSYRNQWLARLYFNSNGYASSYTTTNPYSTGSDRANECEGIRHQIRINSTSSGPTITQDFMTIARFKNYVGTNGPLSSDVSTYVLDAYKIIKVVIWN